MSDGDRILGRLRLGLATLVALVGVLVCTAVAAAAPPAGVTANALDARVDVAWQPAAGAAAYNVYRGTAAGSITTRVSPAGGITATSYLDTTAANGTTYFYAVRAVIAGVESPNSLAVQAGAAATSCTAGNAVVVENCRPGRSNWTLRNPSAGIEGFATAQSIDNGESVDLKVNSTGSTTMDVEIYRTGYYGGAGARLLSTLKSIPVGPQPSCNRTTTLGLVDCSNWSVTATLSTTSSWASGIYLLRIVRADNANDNFIILAVRDDSRQPDVLYGSAFTTFQAYNSWGGWSLYDWNSSGGNTVSGAPRAVKVSFDRPYNQTITGQRDWYTVDEIATVYWLEQSGYDVSYASDADLESRPSLILNAGAYLSPSHDEYWSAGMRTAATAGRDAGVNLFFAGSNEVYWKIRFESSATGQPGRVQVCYKSTQSGGADPSGIPTGTWRDPAGANNPENALTGVMYVGDNDFGYFPLRVSSTQGADRIWRYTGLDALAPNASVNIGQTLVGWEWDSRVANGREPAGLKTLAGSPVTGNLIQGNGAFQTPGSTTAMMTKYTAPSGALVLTVGTNHWNRGLAQNVPREGEPDVRIQQATTNILADMGALPATPDSDITVDGGSSAIPGPTGASASTQGSDSLRVAWNAVAGASGYNVYRTAVPRDGGQPLGVRVNSGAVTGTSFTDTGLSAGTTYYYVVTGVVNGVQTAVSNEASGTTSTSASDPTRINAGGPAYAALSGTTWRADTFFTGGSTFAITQAITGTADPALYQNERWGQFSYAIPVANGTWEVRFHFAELYYGTTVGGSCVGKRIFGMNIVDTPGTDLTNIDICAAVGPRAAYIRTVANVSVTDGTLNIVSVYGSADDPEVTAIEVVPAAPPPPTPPTVTASTPANGATGLASSTRPTATFSRAMDPTTITTSSFNLTVSGGGPTVAASVAYDGTSRVATVTPDHPLADGTTYVATLTTAIRAADGVALAAPVTWSFATSAPPPQDTTPPQVAISAPAGGATVSAGVAVNATASDDRGVVGVQFLLDGNPLGAEDTTAPYGVTWDTLAANNGSHVLSATARDAAGNTATSAPVTVTVFNAPPDTTPPTASVTAPQAGATVAGTVTLQATANDDTGVVGVTFAIDGVVTGAEDTTAPYTLSWSSAAVPNGPHGVTAIARDAAGNSVVSAAVAISVDNDVTAPTVAVTAPAGGATVTGTTALTATADDDVDVVGVRFRIDGVPVGAEDTSAPYGLSWDSTTVTDGSHVVTAVARDAAGNSATSAGVSITVNNDVTPPTVSLTAPAAGATVSGSVTVTASASDARGVVGVQFKVDGVDVGAEDTTAPYSIVWATSGADNGSRTITAVARDAAGNVGTSAGRTVTVANDVTPPAVSVTAPAAGATVSGSVTVTASATDAVGVVGVQFKVDGVNLGAEDTTAPYSVAWATTGIANGDHTLTAVARDAAANNATSAGVTVTVGNDVTAPAVSVTAPAAGASVSGSVTVTASATDAVGVVGVQFRVDGVNVGAEDTTAPYSIAWATTGSTNGSHALTAVARDAAGNSTTSDAVTVTVANSGPPPGTTLVGTTTVESNIDFNSAGMAEAFRTTSLAAGPLTALRVYLDNTSAATRVVVGIYTNATNNRPGTLLTQATITAPVRNAWNTVTVPTVQIASGTTYWVAILGPTGAGVVRFRDRSNGTGAAETSSQTNLATLPATWSRGTVYTDGPISMYGIT